MKRKGSKVEIRISSQMKAAWMVAADKEDMSLSDWIRRRCNAIVMAESKR